MGDNSKEQIATFEYDIDYYGQKILPAKNLYYARPVKISGITNAVKVEALGDTLVILKSDGSAIKVSKYMKEDTSEKEVIANENIVDISAKERKLKLIR